MFTQAQINAILAAFTTALQSLVTAEQLAGQVQTPPAGPSPAEIAAKAAAKARQDKIDALNRELAELNGTAYVPPVENAPAPAPVVVPIVPAPAPVTLPREVTFSYSGPNGGRVDDIVPAGTPGTRLCPQTGHVLSDPQPGPVYGEGEMFMGYLMRIYQQAGQTVGALSGLGALFLGTEHLFTPFGGWKGDGSNWHLAADRYFNGEAYMTEAEKAAARAAQAEWDKHWEEKKAAYAAQASGQIAPHPTQPNQNRPHPNRPGKGDGAAPVVEPVKPATPAGEDVPIGS